MRRVAPCRRRPALVAAVLAWAAVGPAGAAAQGRAVVSLQEIRTARLVMQDFDISCAAAAVATVLTYQHGDPVTERQAARALIDRPEYLDNPEIVRVRLGFSLLDMKRFVDSLGYEGVGYGRLALDDLAERVPAIVPVWLNAAPHFVVVKGIEGGRVAMADPAFGNRSLSVARFMDAWIETPELGRVGFVVRRTDGVEPPNRLVPRSHDLAGASDAALRAARAGMAIP